jgi:hypothetical protein
MSIYQRHPQQNRMSSKHHNVESAKAVVVAAQGVVEQEQQIDPKPKHNPRERRKKGIPC